MNIPRETLRSINRVCIFAFFEEGQVDAELKRICQMLMDCTKNVQRGINEDEGQLEELLFDAISRKASMTAKPAPEPGSIIRKAHDE